MWSRREWIPCKYKIGKFRLRISVTCWFQTEFFGLTQSRFDIFSIIINTCLGVMIHSWNVTIDCRFESHSKSQRPLPKALSHFELAILGVLSLHHRRGRSCSVVDPGNKVDPVPFSGCVLRFTAWPVLRHVAWHCRYERPIFFDLLQNEQHIFRKEDYQYIGCRKVPTTPPISGNIGNIKHIFVLTDNMSSIHHSTKTKTKSYSSHVLITVNLSVVLLRDGHSQSWTKSNGDSSSNMSLSRDGATKRLPLSYAQPSTILLCPVWLSKDRSYSSKMAIYPVMTIQVLVDPSQYWDRSCRNYLIGMHFRAPELYQDTFAFLLQLRKKSRDESWDKKIQQKMGSSFAF
jgi:hypothetical protein